jgi:hypothetical protein
MDLLNHSEHPRRLPGGRLPAPGRVGRVAETQHISDDRELGFAGLHRHWLHTEGVPVRNLADAAHNDVRCGKQSTHLQPVHLAADSARAREALAQYLPGLSLQRLLVEEGGTDTLLYRAPHSDCFKTDTRVFPAVEFLVEVLQHSPDSRSRLTRTYGPYSSRPRGTPGPAAARQRYGRVVPCQPHLLRLAPEGLDAYELETRSSARLRSRNPSSPCRPKVREADRRGPAYQEGSAWGDRLL